jgi:hypothetical protein
MRTFGAEATNMPVRFSATRATIDDIQMIYRLIATLDVFFLR